VLGDGRQPRSCLALGLVEVGDADQATEIRVTPQLRAIQEQLVPSTSRAAPDQRL